MRTCLRTMVAILFCLAAQPTVAFAQDHDGRGTPAIATDHGRDERVFNLSLNEGERLSVLFATPASPRGTIVMLPGGAGDIGLGHDGHIRHGDNFVVRTRELWNRRGYAVLIPDTSDHANLRGHRTSPAYARVVGGLVALARQQGSGPVFLLGTSQGTIAAVNGAAHAPAGSIAGVVLTESVSVMGGSRETVFSASPQDIGVPVLVVANRDDRCNVAPPTAARQIAAAMTASRDVQVQMVAGGITRSKRECGSLTPHGYFGIEDQVINAICNWLDTHA
ncbi:alpha/beta hydrolase [Komagataeibacter oboediens]|uniref:alpha/beta hydrolase n=1 Tax=Komagataeibacter oboediens TaxID=65958 RepID=UPI0020C262E6|nr:alpha/beta hydrolase [Komagataeibacter oboediens]